MQDGGSSVHKLIIYTVGTTPEPIVFCIQQEQPERLIFVASPQTEDQVESSILPKLNQEGFRIQHGQFDIIKIPDPEDFETCVRTLRDQLENEVHDWLQRGSNFSLAVDLTGGTKCMSSALTLVASRWKAEFLYVGGQRIDPRGTVEPGTERVIRRANPWDSLGYQVIEDAVLFFDHGLYASTIHVLDKAIHRIDRNAVKRELATLKILASAYNAWDRFNFKGAANELGDVLKNFNDLRHACPFVDQSLEQTLSAHREHLLKLWEKKPSQLNVLDLLANAQRRAAQGAYDDAVARLYRAVEAFGQITLGKYKKNTKTAEGKDDPSTFNLSDLPPDLQEKWKQYADENGTLKLGLQRTYELLKDLHDPLGEEFASSKLSGPHSPLAMRNKSILAHGFEPVTQDGFQSLWDAVLKLVQVKESDLVCFPKLNPIRRGADGTSDAGHLRRRG